MMIFLLTCYDELIKKLSRLFEEATLKSNTGSL
jgi:hypothetical protein